jgi:glucans biosynthesis protein
MFAQHSFKEVRLAAAIIIGFALPGVCFAKSKQPATFELKNVLIMAQRLAKEPYKAPKLVSEPWAGLSYDQWRNIRFKPGKALWKNENVPFNIQFFHSGFLYTAPITIHVVEDKIRRLPFDKNGFDYSQVNIDTATAADTGYGGFRIHYPLNKPSYKDEVALFLGASYFRAVGKNQVFGLSARGIALNTAASTPEEFPAFKEFWIVKPPEGAETLTVYALLDSVSMTGAYKFVIDPGAETVMDVTAQIIPRQPVERIGVAPLTGMFFFGENLGDQKVPDFRPEVHDNDGLSITLNNNEHIWRPLVNPVRLFVNVFEAQTLQEFGLEQRDENFDHYQDLESRYEKRPSAWIKPQGNWGPGKVYLIQIPTPNEVNDNVVAFWSPNQLPANGPATYSYQLRWGSANAHKPPTGYVTSTRYTMSDEARIKFVIDFEGKDLNALSADTALNAIVSVPQSYGVDDVVVMKNEVTNGWRLVFKLKLPSDFMSFLPGKKEAVELRATLQKDGQPVTETWSFALEL